MISVVVPAYNASKTIVECLSALADQTHPQSELEIIVVDDGSTDDTAKLARKCGAKVISAPHLGPAAARNHGIAAASGEIVLFTDADCMPAPDWVDQMVAPIYAGADGVKGAYLTRQRGVLPRFVQAEFEERYVRLAKLERIDFVDSYSAAYRKDLLERTGGFDPTFPVPSAEDIDLSFRLASLGAHLVFAPSARVFHWHPSQLRSYLGRKFRYGAWRVLVYRRFPRKLKGDSYTPRLMIGQIALAALTWATAALAAVLPQILVFSGVIALVFVSSTIPFALRAGRREPMVGIASPVLIFLRSTAQGCGLLAGMVRIVLGATLKRSGRFRVRVASDESRD